MSAKPELLLQGAAEVGEGPIFLGDSLLWVDIPAGKVYKTNLASLDTATTSFDLPIGAVAPCENSENLALATKDGFALWSDGRLDIRDPFLLGRDYRMNDAKCDARGKILGRQLSIRFSTRQRKVTSLGRWN